jgi:hypothetical protein
MNERVLDGLKYFNSVKDWYHLRKFLELVDLNSILGYQAAQLRDHLKSMNYQS